MLGLRTAGRRRAGDEAEKPFWISFADLMTAMMVLFMVVMGVALLAVTKTVTETEQQEAAHNKKVEILLQRFEDAAKRHPGVQVDRIRHVIDFGDRARFPFGDWRLAADQEAVLREFTPEIISLASDEVGLSVLKRIVVEGYTDRRGSYLSNLNLSLKRSQSVLCAMFATTGQNLLPSDQKEAVRNLFFVGGYSFNAARSTDEESRRVEMRLEFLGRGEQRQAPLTSDVNFGECTWR